MRGAFCLAARVVKREKPIPKDGPEPEVEYTPEQEVALDNIADIIARALIREAEEQREAARQSRRRTRVKSG